VSDYDIRTVDLTEVAGLRSALLDRSGSAASDPSAGDEHPSTRHVGAFRDEVLVGVASIFPGAMPGESGTNSWRLAAIAVDYGHRGIGIGGSLAERCLEHAAALNGRSVWCIAPAGAFGFFERFGFGRSGDPIDDPNDGPQYLLFTEVRPLSRSWALPGA